MSSSYPGAIKPIQLLQLQRRHVPSAVDLVTDSSSLFYNCTTRKHAVPPPPLHHALELQDHASLLSAAAPAYVHPHPGWPPARVGSGRVAEAQARRWRQCAGEPAGGGRRHQGRVKWYNHQKKYGFIISKDSKEYFVHRDDLKPANAISEPHLFTGEYVEYDPMPTEDGRLKASNVSGIEKGPLMCDHGRRV